MRPDRIKGLGNNKKLRGLRANARAKKLSLVSRYVRNWLKKLLLDSISGFLMVEEHCRLLIAS